MKDLKGCKDKVYTLLNNNKDKIENLLNKTLTKDQTEEVMKSLLDERNFLPNMLTLSRLPGIPIVYLASLTKNPYLIASILTIISITDAMDGYAARKITKNPNKGGALLDSCVDKLYTVSLIVPAILEEPILAINGGFETAIGLINRDATKKGSEQKSTKFGKLKMWPLSIIISLTYLNHCVKSDKLSTIISVGSLLTLVLELINVFEYRDMAKKNLNNVDVDNMKLDELHELRDKLVLCSEDEVVEKVKK